MLPPVSPSTPDAAAAAATASLIANAANLLALQLTSSTAAADEKLPTVEAVVQQSAELQSPSQQQLKAEWQHEQQELLFSPPASPIAAVAGALTGTGAASGGAYARSRSPAAAPVIESVNGGTPQQPALQSLRLVTTQLSTVPATATAAAGTPSASRCQFTAATQATLQATTANVVATDALATAMAAARINHKSPGLPAQQQAAVLPDWLCRSSADLAASAAVVQSSLLNTTAALARLQQHQKSLVLPHGSPAVAAAAMGPSSVTVPSSGVACFGLQNSTAAQQQQQQQQCGPVVLGTPVAGAKVIGVPLYPAQAPLPATAAECDGLFGRLGAAERVLDEQLLDQDMDDAISCNSTPQSAAAARSPRSPCWQSRLQEGSNSNGVNEGDEDTDDTASSGYSDDCSSFDSGSSSDDESEDSEDDDAEDAAPCAADAIAVRAAAKTALEDEQYSRHPVGLEDGAPADAAVTIVLV